MSVKGEYRCTTGAPDIIRIERSSACSELTVSIWYNGKYEASVVLSAADAKAMSKRLMYEAVASEGKQ